MAFSTLEIPSIQLGTLLASMIEKAEDCLDKPLLNLGSGQVGTEFLDLSFFIRIHRIRQL
jgi:hypothetical protein